jgi:hypothetical protein
MKKILKTINILKATSFVAKQMHSDEGIPICS